MRGGNPRTDDRDLHALPVDVTELLNRWSGGDRDALHDLMPRVYGELRRLAALHVARERNGATLQPTALVHEAYLRLVNQKNIHYESRLNFYAAAAQMMRRVLCDRARQRKAQKRGGGAVHIPIDLESVTLPLDLSGDGREPDRIYLEHLDEALEELERLDQRKVRVVELRFFAGLPVHDTAAALGLSPATIKREWMVARAWLANRLEQSHSGSRNPGH